jgi:hypothetical protein
MHSLKRLWKDGYTACGQGTDRYFRRVKISFLSSFVSAPILRFQETSVSSKPWSNRRNIML